MTLRDWLSIVGALLIPVMIAAGTWWITWQQGKIEDQRADVERELAEQRAQDEALQAYLDQMGSLLIERDLRASEEDSEVRTLARARTLTVLERLDPSRKTAVMQFLVEAKLVQRVEGTGPIIRLSGADLSSADLGLSDLSSADLFDADLREANLIAASLREANLWLANLSGANLWLADLREANLYRANLYRANLREAGLDKADLTRADLREADLRKADLGEADLSGANLSGANLYRANLSVAGLVGPGEDEANLSGANLRKADLGDANLTRADLAYTNGITNEELEQQAKSLEGATMPNGQKYEDWLKDRERKKNGENE
jgi:uncharacterized protein YjbI with pentapeptide repeats